MAIWRIYFGFSILLIGVIVSAELNETQAENSTITSSGACGENYFHCGSGECIISSWRCDAQPDCVDGSDEDDYCEHSCGYRQFTCESIVSGSRPNCISTSWVCDGQEDCDRGDDERDCGTEPSCPSDRFYCSGEKRCMPKSWICDGDNDCVSGEDEMNCTGPALPTSSPTCTSLEFQCVSGNPRCIILPWRNDGENDCADGSDETHLQINVTCSNSEFKCEADDVCIPNFLTCSGKSECSDGADETLDRCTEPTSPSLPLHHCDEGMFSCNPEAVNGSVCVSRDSICDGSDDCLSGRDESSDICDVLLKLLFAGRLVIRSINLQGNLNQTTVKSTAGSSTALDYDYSTHEIFYNDAAERKLLKFISSLKPSEEEPLTIGLNISGSQLADGIAYDWTYKNLYWSDTSDNTIKMASLGGEVQTRESLVLYQNSDVECVGTPNVTTGNEVCIDEPRAVVVYPRKGWIFWSDWGRKPHIAMAALDGSHMEMVAYNTEGGPTYLIWPNGLALDATGETEHLYWIDARLSSIFSCPVNGCINNIRVVLHDTETISHPFSLTLFEDDLYWTDWRQRQILSANKHTGGDIRRVVSNISQPMGVKVVHPSLQPNSTNHCEPAAGDSQSRCEQICSPKPWSTSDNSSSASVGVPRYSCLCVDGYQLNDDLRSCREISPAIFPTTETAIPSAPTWRSTTSRPTTARRESTSSTPVYPVTGRITPGSTATTPSTRINHSKNIHISLDKDRLKHMDRLLLQLGLNISITIEK